MHCSCIPACSFWPSVRCLGGLELQSWWWLLARWIQSKGKRKFISKSIISKKQKKVCNYSSVSNEVLGNSIEGLADETAEWNKHFDSCSFPWENKRGYLNPLVHVSCLGAPTSIILIGFNQVKSSKMSRILWRIYWWCSKRCIRDTTIFHTKWH